jgi:mannose-6-phosphate isomerase-like protein (cupin superfamily)
MTEPFTATRDEHDPSPWQLLATGETTGGVAIVGEARVPPHTAPVGLHVHSREDEIVYVVSGTLTFVIGERRFEAGPGTLVWMPKEVPHAFANLGDEPVWSVGTIVPAGIEPMFLEQAEYMAGLQGPPDPKRIAEIGARYGVRTLGPPLQP